MDLQAPAAGYDANGRSVRHAWSTPAGIEAAGWLSTWNGPSGVGTNRRVAEERVGALFSGPGPAHLDTYVLDSAYRQRGFTRNSTIGSVRTLDGANKMTAFIDEGTWRAPAVDQHADPSENGLNQYSAMDGLPWTLTDNGALATDSVLSHQFDAAGRLVRSNEVLTGTELLENVYDADGRRVLSRSGSGTVRFLFHGWQVLEERDGTNAVLRQYVTGRWMDDHVQMTDVATGEPYYYHSNEQGFVGALTNSAAFPVEYYEFSWLGRPAVRNPLLPGSVTEKSAFGNPYLFQGRRWEPDVKLYDFRHRWYSPSFGEFISLDPSGTWRHGMGNGYDAFGGNPWDSSDALGLETWILVADPGEGKGAFGHVGLFVRDPSGRVGIVDYGGGSGSGDDGRAWRRTDGDGRLDLDEAMAIFVDFYADHDRATSGWELDLSPEQEESLLEHIWENFGMFSGEPHDILRGRHCGTAVWKAYHGYDGAPAEPDAWDVPYHPTINPFGHEKYAYPGKSPSAWRWRLKGMWGAEAYPLKGTVRYEARDRTPRPK